MSTEEIIFLLIGIFLVIGIIGTDIKDWFNHK